MRAAVATVLDGYLKVSRKLRMRTRLAICRLVGDKLLPLYKLNKQTLSALLTSWSQPTPPFLFQIHDPFLPGLPYGMTQQI